MPRTPAGPTGRECVYPNQMSPAPDPSDELVVLLDAAGAAIGSARKADVHTADTPRHLAFSCYVLDAQGRLLVSRRARTKRTFPGVLTNSVCGHPGPGEALPEAVVRRAQAELGLELTPDALRLVLPDFSYRAEMGGIVEHELCPVFLATVPDNPLLQPDPQEVASVAWIPWADYRDQVLAGTLEVSAWSSEQVRQLSRLGGDPGDWPEADATLLPPAARVGPGVDRV